MNRFIFIDDLHSSFPPSHAFESTTFSALGTGLNIFLPRNWWILLRSLLFEATSIRYPFNTSILLLIIIIDFCKTREGLPLVGCLRVWSYSPLIIMPGPLSIFLSAQHQSALSDFCDCGLRTRSVSMGWVSLILFCTLLRDNRGCDCVSTVPRCYPFEACRKEGAQYDWVLRRLIWLT